MCLSVLVPSWRVPLVNLKKVLKAYHAQFAATYLRTLILIFFFHLEAHWDIFIELLEHCYGTMATG